MGKSIFVSYKYVDTQVQDLEVYEVTDFFGTKRRIATTARHYVDEIAKILEEDDHIYKGENDGESMVALEDATIASKLGDKIFYSSITIVLVSKGMKEVFSSEKDQWIPWEIPYSLKDNQDKGEEAKQMQSWQLYYPISGEVITILLEKILVYIVIAEH